MVSISLVLSFSLAFIYGCRLPHDYFNTGQLGKSITVSRSYSPLRMCDRPALTTCSSFLVLGTKLWWTMRVWAENRRSAAAFFTNNANLVSLPRIHRIMAAMKVILAPRLTMSMMDPGKQRLIKNTRLLGKR